MQPAYRRINPLPSYRGRPMVEDFSPYMVPDSTGAWGTWPRQHHDTGNGFDSGDLYLKSIPADNPSRELDELLELLTSTTSAYLANFRVDGRIPYPMRHSFYRDMKLFPSAFPSRWQTPITMPSAKASASAGPLRRPTRSSSPGCVRSPGSSTDMTGSFPPG